MSTRGSEVAGIETWLFGLLSGDATVQGIVGAPPNARVYQGHVPQGQTTFPCVVFASQGDDPDTRIVGPQRIMATRHYLVKAIDNKPSALGIADLVDQIDVLLEGQQNGSARSTSIFACQREHAVDYPEVDQGVEYRHLGAVYKILAQKVGP